MKVINVLSFLVLMALSMFASAQNPVPFLNQALQPSSTAPGGPSFTLTVNGTAFVSGATINWNGVPLTTSFVSVVELTATVPSVDIAKAGTASITATNPAPGGGTSNVEFFSITNPATSVELTEADFAFGGVAVVGDFNGDGKPDLITSGDGLTVLLGTGDGGFSPPISQPYLSNATFLVSGDFNEDGKLDLAAFEFFDGMQVVLGNGDGTFSHQSSFTVGTNSPGYGGLTAADFDRDGKLDLVLTSFDARPNTNVIFFRGNGDGTFAAPVLTEFVNAQLEVDVFTDFNEDGKLDFTDAGNFLSLGNGDGTFQQPQTLNSGAPGSVAAAADMNGDGKLDLVVGVVDAQGSIAVLPGNGDGTFQSAIITPTGDTTGSFALAVGDINGDGKLDVAVVTNLQTSPNLLILQGNGDGTFQAPQSYPVKAAPQSLYLADLNGDGKMDLIGPGQSGATVFLQGTFPAFSAAPSSLTYTARPVGTTSPAQIITLTNSGGLTMTISGISITGSDAGDFSQTNTCGSSLAVGASCDISVTFTPTAVGTRSAAVNFADNAPGSPQTIALTGTVEDFMVVANPPTSQTVTPGQAANYMITVSPSEGFKQTIVFTCSGQPGGSTCTFTPGSVTLDGTNPATVGVAVVTTAATMSSANPDSKNPGVLFAVFVGIFGIAIVVSPVGKRRGRFYGVALLCLLAIGTMPACGGGGSPTSGSGGTPLGTDTIKVTGTYTAGSSTLSHSADLTLVVQ